MGTNYYVQAHTCPTCRRSERIHIGKSSVGWRFIFRGYERDDGEQTRPYNITDWKIHLADENVQIFDEYDRPVSKTDFWAMVVGKKDQRHDPNAIHDDLADILLREFS